MALADTIRRKLDRVLARVDATDRTVYKRLTNRSGGDQLIGRSVSVATNDTLLTPQPSVQPMVVNYPLVVAGAALTPNGEYIATVSATAITRDEVTNPTLVIVFKRGDKVEVLNVVGFSPAVLNGQDISFDLVLASKSR